MVRTTLEGLGDEIAKAIKEYTDDVKEGIEIELKEVADTAVKELKANSPKDTGEYAKGWRKKKVKGGYVISNKVYQLTHLLEKGHAKRNGGRVAPRVHIKPVEEAAIIKTEQGIEKIIISGGKG
ncbi:HK97 gp10 family phage protein [Senegalia massiliensis]|uniref:HK97 gp10 family phage protein n=1 Tax=Senegalia massiliensis TaxID=1720316 RepID=UPI001031399E|nr:HK97 gp10 family phage protein [Senegalia massiliensis]